MIINARPRKDRIVELPRLNELDIAAAIPQCEEIGSPLRGGQKLVFPCRVASKRYALKLMLKNEANGEEETQLDEVEERAAREVELMRQFDDPHLVKMGPLGLTHAEIAGQRVIFFTEEWIDGLDVKTILRQQGPLSPKEVSRLGIEMAGAIDLLWTLDIVHRDIKPGNIMRRDATGEYVLLDMGIALNLSDISLTRSGRVAMTPAYASPEQLNLSRKRYLDFRSDQFALGIVLYEALTCQHPFLRIASPNISVTYQIQNATVDPPSSIRSDIPRRLDMIICRLLEKKPQLRYRDCTTLQRALQSALN